MAVTQGTFSDYRWVIGSVHGYSSAAVTANQYLTEWVSPFNCLIGGVQSYADTAGTGAGNTVVDILVNGTSIWLSTADRPTLASASTGAMASAAPTARAVRQGDRVSIQVVTIPAATGHARVRCTLALESLRSGLV